MQTRSSSRLVSDQSSNPTSSMNLNPKGPITADNFELKHGLLTLVQNKQFYGHDKKDPHAHIRYFNKITSTLKLPNVPNTLRNEITNFQQRFDESFSEAWGRFKDLLRACPHHGFSELHQLDTFYNALNSKDQDPLNSAAGGNFLDKMPRDCLSIIESKSKVRYSRDKPVVSKVSTNASTSDVSPDVAEFKDMVKALLLNKKGQNQSPAPVKAVEESCVTYGGAYSFRNYPATDGNVYRDNIQEYVSQASAVNYNQGNTGYRPQMMSNQIRPPGFRPVPKTCYQPSVFQQPALAPQTQGVSKEDFSAYVKANDAVMKKMQTQGQNMQNQLTNLTNLITKFVNSNTASTSSLGTLPSNMIANPKSDLKSITTRSGVSYDGPQIPPPVVENEPEATKDIVNPTNNENTEDVQPQAVQSKSPISISKPAVAPVSTSKPNPKASILYPSKRKDEMNHEKANNQIEKFYQIFKDMSFKIRFADALILMPKFASTLKALIGNKKKLSMAECLALADLDASINLMPYCMWKRLSLPYLTPTCITLELSDRSTSRPVGVAEDVYVKVGSFHFSADSVVVDFDVDPRVPLILERSFLETKRALIDVFEEYSKEFLDFSDTISSGNPTPFYDPIVSTTSSTLTPFGNSDFLLEEVDAFLAVEDEPTSSNFQQPYLIPEGDILLLEAFLNDDPSSPPPNQRNYLPEVRKELKICKAKTDKSSVHEPPVVELKALPPHLEYAFLEGDDKLPVIIAKYLSGEEKTTLITVLKSHKRAIAWKLSDIKGTNPEFCTHKILMEEDFTPAVQYQRRVNPKIHDVIKQEVIKLLGAGLIYPIFDSPWVSPVHYVPKKGGFTVAENEDNELIPTRLVTGWHVCIDYRKLNEATRKDHFPLPFMDRMLERLAGNQYYCFLDGFFGYFQIPIDPKDQEKTTFTCPYGTFAYCRMPFGLCNVPGTFQRCMMAIFHDMIEKTIEVFMDDFFVFWNSFQSCLSHLEKMLKRCEDTNLCLNWEKSHFMVKEGIVLGHKISKQGIEVDKAKVDVISKLPHPTTVKDQYSLNSAASGKFLDKMPHECLAIIESKSKVRYSRNKPVVAKVSTNTSTFGISPDVGELKDMVKASLLDKKSQSPAPVKAVEESCVTYGGNTSYRPPMMSNQIRPPSFPLVANNQNVQRNNQNHFFPNQTKDLFINPRFFNLQLTSSYLQAPAPQTHGVSKEDFSAYIKANDAVMRNMQTQGQNMQNQLTNLIDLITKFMNSNSTSTSSSGTLPSNIIANPRSDLKVITTRSCVSYDEPQISPPLSFLPKVVENKPEATKDTVNPTNNRSTKDVQPQVVQSESPFLISKPVTSLIYEPVIALKLPKKLGDPGKFLIPCDFLRMAEWLALADLSASINLMPFFVLKILSLHDLTPMYMNLELANHSISHSVGVAEDVYVKVGSFHFLTDFVVVDFDADPRVPLILERSFLKTGRALTDVFKDELTLHVGKEAITFNLDKTSRYSANYSDMMAKRIDVIDMACEEYSQEVLGFSDTISSGNPTPYYDPIVSTTSLTLTPFENSDFLLEEFDAFLAIEDDPTSLEFYQPFLDPEGDIIILETFLNDDPSLPSPKQGNYLLEVRKELKIFEAKSDKSSVDEPLEDQEKITFTCPYGTFSYRRMPFGLCNALGTFQRCMMEIFHDMIKKTMEVFMDDFSIFSKSFQSCLSHLERMLKRCEDTNLCLNWEKSHFMVKEDFAIGAVLGQRQDKYFRPIHYASKTMTEAESNYTTTKKEMLEVVKPLKSSRLATIDPQEVTMALITQPG
nr:reverse transcriptase domain-containing protein [Tanacetum cinerariifolium]GEX67843.1 reverse transcriptase domain-containing protein [Tanacetum cinerariifolium]